MNEPAVAAIIAGLVTALIVALAALRPATRRWIAAGFALAAGLLVAFYAVVVGALAQMDTGGGIPPLLVGVAILATGAGLGLAIWILRSGGARRVAPPTAPAPPDVPAPSDVQAPPDAPAPSAPD